MKMSALDTLPPRYGESGLRYKQSPSRSQAPSRLMQMQARFQAKQMVEKEEKLINLLEEKHENHRTELPRIRKKENQMSVSMNAATSSMYADGGSRYGSRQNIYPLIQDKLANSSRFSPVGWDKSYPLKPVQAMNTELRKPLYTKQKVTNSPSYNKYSGNYGVQTPGPKSKRGLSLDRSYGGGDRERVSRYSRGGMTRTQSQTYIGSSSEESYLSSRPHSGLDYRQDNTRTNYNLGSPDESPVLERRESHGSRDFSQGSRDYTRPLPPTYKRSSNHIDSAYSSHSSDRSDTNPVNRARSNNSSTKSSYNRNKLQREHSSSYDDFNKLNTRTFRKQKSPLRREYRSPSVSPARSEEYSDDDSYTSRVKVKSSDREREEERRRMQFEMRKREQELLAKIKDQQKELEAVKAEKNKVEKSLIDRPRTKDVEIKIKKTNIDEDKNKKVYPRSSERLFQRERSTHNYLRGVKPSESMRNLSSVGRQNSTVEDDKPERSRFLKAKQPAKPPTQPKKAAAPAARRSVFAPKPRDDLIQCKRCSRNFAEDRIEKHEEICFKTAAKKRKTYDMTKARVTGTDAAAYVRNSAQLNAKLQKEQTTKAVKKADWRKKREEFINTLRAAKEAQRHVANGGSLKDLPPPPPMDTSDYVQCSHCNRRFSEAAAERHIPKCKNIKSNKK